MVDLKRTYGVVVALVVDTEDPENLGRVKVKYPWLPDSPESDWCRVSMPFAGNEHGSFFAPEIDSEALVAFEQGEFDRPYIVGYLWSGETTLPSENNAERMIKSVSGNTIILNDTEGEEGITLTDQHGNTIVMNKDGIEIKASKITLTAEGELQAVGNPIHLNP